VSLAKILRSRQANSRPTPKRRVQFHKRGQQFICAHDETLSVAMRISNPDRSPVRING